MAEGLARGYFWLALLTLTLNRRQPPSQIVRGPRSCAAGLRPPHAWFIPCFWRDGIGPAMAGIGLLIFHREQTNGQTTELNPAGSLLRGYSPPGNDDAAVLAGRKMRGEKKRITMLNIMLTLFPCTSLGIGSSDISSGCVLVLFLGE